jgi:hypothetical protein
LGDVLRVLAETVMNVASGVKYLIGLWEELLGLNGQDLSLPSAPGMPGYRAGNPAGTGGGRETGIPAPVDTVVVNVNGITPTAVVGRTVLDALTKTRRLGIR